MKVTSCKSSGMEVSPAAYNACTFQIIDKWNPDQHAKTCDTMFYLSDGTGAYVWDCDHWIFLDFTGVTLSDWAAKQNEAGYIKNKPFTTLGNGLSVDEKGVLNVNLTLEPIMYTAYANSADGTDGFTTVYPALNLLSNSLFTSPIKTTPDSNSAFYGLQSNVVGFEYVPSTSSRDLTISSLYVAGLGLPIGMYTSSITIANNSETVATVDLLLAQGTADTDIRPVVNGNSVPWWFTAFGNPGVTINIPAKSNARYTFTFTAKSTNNTGSGHDHFIIFRETTAVPVTRYSKPKLEPGSIATPYMPSASEVTTADWPKYVGHYASLSKEQSLDPKKYIWDSSETNTVNSVNGKSKDVILKGTDIIVSADDSRTVSEAIKDSLEGFVHKEGDEVIGGNKTFTGSIDFTDIIDFKDDRSWRDLPSLIPSGWEVYFTNSGYQIRDKTLTINIFAVGTQKALEENTNTNVLKIPNVTLPTNFTGICNVLPGDNAHTIGKWTILKDGTVQLRNYEAVPAQTGENNNHFNCLIVVPIV